MAQLKVASKRRVQVAMEGKVRERWGDFILSAILMLVSEWERITKDATKVLLTVVNANKGKQIHLDLFPFAARTRRRSATRVGHTPTDRGV